MYICLFIMDDPRDIGHGPSPRTARIGAKAARMIRVLRLVAASGPLFSPTSLHGEISHV